MENNMEVWYVGQVFKYKEPPKESTWGFIGVFDSEEKAKEACKDELYFIGPIELNRALPGQIMQNPRAYYPLMEESK
jgi:hypothetical protein